MATAFPNVVPELDHSVATTISGIWHLKNVVYRRIYRIKYIQSSYTIVVNEGKTLAKFSKFHNSFSNIILDFINITDITGRFT